MVSNLNCIEKRICVIQIYISSVAYLRLRYFLMGMFILLLLGKDIVGLIPGTWSVVIIRMGFASLSIRSKFVGQSIESLIDQSFVN